MTSTSIGFFTGSSFKPSCSWIVTAKPARSRPREPMPIPPILPFRLPLPVPPVLPFLPIPPFLPVLPVPPFPVLSVRNFIQRIGPPYSLQIQQRDAKSPAVRRRPEQHRAEGRHDGDERHG